MPLQIPLTFLALTCWIGSIVCIIYPYNDREAVFFALAAIGYSIPLFFLKD